MTPQERTFRATDAKQLLENKLFVDAFDAVAGHLNMQALTCDPDNAEKARRIVISQQLLAAVKREVTRIVTDGAVAEVQIAELEKRNKLAFFRR